VSRIDHGVRSIEDEILVDFLAKSRMPLTVCPLSNVKLCVFRTMQEHTLKQLLDKGLCIGSVLNLWNKSKWDSQIQSD
jgi:adenosine deaminase